MGPPHPPHFVRLTGEPVEYLLIDMDFKKASVIPFFLIINGSLLLSISLGVGVALFLIFRFFRDKVELADHVISELKRGNLKARFPIPRPIHHLDEAGQFMNRFNQMAEEIERLVEQMRSAERSRTTLLQDLAHDLRTPVASMKHMLEMLKLRDASLGPEARLKFLGLSLQEVEYFARLVEDLLVLAQVAEPRYQGDTSVLILNDLILSEVALIEVASRHTPKISIFPEIASESLKIRGDEHLLRRMLRNVLDNAMSYAHSKVSVKLERINAQEIQITVRDDGPGFSSEALRSYGDRRVSRTLGFSPGRGSSDSPERVSVGLGSVIIRTVAHLHGGTLSATNHESGGACVILGLPAV
jgi:K+-sensing histidine kinase KdpD